MLLVLGCASIALGRHEQRRAVGEAGYCVNLRLSMPEGRTSTPYLKKYCFGNAEGRGFAGFHEGSLQQLDVRYFNVQILTEGQNCLFDCNPSTNLTKSGEKLKSHATITRERG